MAQIYPLGLRGNGCPKLAAVTLRGFEHFILVKSHIREAQWSMPLPQAGLATFGSKPCW